MSVHTQLTEVPIAEMKGDNMCTDTKKEMSVSREDRCLGERDEEGSDPRVLRHVWWQIRHKVSTLGIVLILISHVKT